MKPFKGPAKQRGFFGLFSGTGGKILSGLGGLLGGAASYSEYGDAIDQINSNTDFRSQSGNTGFGSFGVTADGANNFSFNSAQQALQAALQGQSMGQLGGGFFNDAGFQQAFGANDIAGALGQAQGGLQQQIGPSAFGGLGNLFNQNAGLSQGFAGQLAAGPQDLSGGLMGNLMGQGYSNQLAAGDQSGLYNQSLATQRAAATNGGLLDMAINKFQDRAHATGRDAFSSFGNDQRAFLNSIADQDLSFQNNAFGQAQQQQNFLGNLGAQQIGQAANFLGQNLGQYNQIGNMANMFGQAAAGNEQQGFGQMLSSLQQNQSAGNQRLQNAMGLFGQGAGLFNDAYSQGLAGLGVQQGFNDQALQTLLGFRNAEANRIGATGMGSQALGNMQSSGGSGIGDFIGGLFSDARLKDNVRQIGTIGDWGWYTWDWNEDAHEVGADTQPNYGVIAQEIAKDLPAAVSTREGYLQVNYDVLMGAV